MGEEKVGSMSRFSRGLFHSGRGRNIINHLLNDLDVSEDKRELCRASLEGFVEFILDVAREESKLGLDEND